MLRPMSAKSLNLCGPLPPDGLPFAFVVPSTVILSEARFVRPGRLSDAENPSFSKCYLAVHAILRAAFRFHPGAPNLGAHDVGLLQQFT